MRRSFRFNAIKRHSPVLLALLFLPMQGFAATDPFSTLEIMELDAGAFLALFVISLILAYAYFARRISGTAAKLQGALSLNHQILMTSATGFAAYRQDGQCVMVNPAFAKVAGGTEEQLLNQNFRRLESWRSTRLLEWADRVLASGTGVEAEIQLTTTFGRHVWLRCHLSRFFTRGKPHLLLMFHDISETRRTEKALLESEEFNRRIIASSSDCIQVLDLDGNLISMSEGGQRQLEIADAGRYIGSPWLNLWEQPGRPAAAAAIAAARRGDMGRFVACCRTETGTPKWWDVVITPIISARGQVERLLAVSRDVTARREEEEQFGLMIRTSLDGFWITDERGRFLEVNDAYCEMVGYSRAELLGMGIPDIEANETPEQTARHLGELMESGSLRFETRHRCKDGHLLDVEVSAKYTPNYGGKVYCFLRDITARKQTEKTLRLRRDQLEDEVQRRTAELTGANAALEASLAEIDDLYQNAPCGYHSLDQDGRIVLINDTELKMLGYTRDELVGTRMQDLLTPAALARFKNDFPQFLEQGQMYGVETELCRKDGSTFPAMVNTSAIYNGLGQFVMSRATLYDMTEHKQAEQIQLRLNRALRLLSAGNAALIHDQDEQSLLTSICRLVVEAGGYRMAWVGFAEQDAPKSIRPAAKFGDNDGYVDGLNLCWADDERGQGPTAVAIRSGTSQVNQDWEHSLALRPWLDKAMQRGYRASIALPIVCTGRVLGSLNIYSADADAFVAEEVRLLEELANNLAFGIDAVRVRAREAAAGEELELHRRHLEDLVAQRTVQLSAAKMEADYANNAKSRFLAAASHDLRQPLTALNLYVGMLKSQLDPDKGELLTKMQECIGGLSNLLSKLLDLSKLDAGVVKPRVGHFAVDDMLNELYAAHAPDAEAKGLRLRCGYGGLTARTDPVLFKRIIGNLVANAVRYTERGGVLIGCRRHHGKMWVEVWDTGIGIPPDKLGEIFDEFKQLGDDARTHGSGLGLTIVAKTADLLRLQMRVQSRLGRGSMFAIELPPGKRAKTAAQPRYRILNLGLRIALVDDNPLVLHALARSLEGAGHVVVAATTGKGLLSQLGGEAPDVAVCDHRLAAGETGYDVIEAVRSAYGSGVPAVIITGDTDPKLMRSMTRKGIAILHKPVELADLEERIEEALIRSAVEAG